jgi:hypothetical protein
VQLTELQQLTHLGFRYTHYERDEYEEMHRVFVSKVSRATGVSVHHHVDVMLLHADYQSHFCSSCRDD